MDPAPGTRVYSVWQGRPPPARLVAWGASRNGSAEDEAIRAAVAERGVLGETEFRVEWAPEISKQRSADTIHKGRRRNRDKWLARRLPLFARQASADFGRDKHLAMETVVADQRHRAELERGYQEAWYKAHDPAMRIDISPE